MILHPRLLPPVRVASGSQDVDDGHDGRRREEDPVCAIPQFRVSLLRALYISSHLTRGPPVTHPWLRWGFCWGVGKGGGSVPFKRAHNDRAPRRPTHGALAEIQHGEKDGCGQKAGEPKDHGRGFGGQDAQLVCCGGQEAR
jgi:hypothetical protein